MIDRNDEPRDDESRGYFVGKNRACSVGEFFKGWRRKAGLVTLVIALLLTAGWMRSAVTVDIHRLSRREAIVSGDGHLVAVLVRRNANPERWYHSIMGRARSDDTDIAEYKWEKHGRRTVLGVEVGRDVLGNGGMPIDEAEWCRIPYWSLVLPLTLLSAWLILTKPRKAKAATGRTP